ncbi:MAG: hypothetical protein RR800_04570 [Comamonas sp.]
MSSILETSADLLIKLLSTRLAACIEATQAHLAAAQMRIDRLA